MGKRYSSKLTHFSSEQYAECRMAEEDARITGCEFDYSQFDEVGCDERVEYEGDNTL